MKIEKKHIKSILTFFQDAYPFPVWELDKLLADVGDETTLIGHLVYLHDKQLIDGEFNFTYTDRDKPWDIRIYSIRINAAGIDYLSEITTVRAAAIL
ncbi:hypothetical protein ACT5AX_002154 [Cronobacter sakazakii]|uniref:hypothetical protein n=1 Tax=Cronobacter sakazakii TaxID=28141 RepID=UPI000DA1BF69|nr:hypothetical protein [Cronobacter sakazakii]MCI0302304.1 hypothetical protein [Cronobacter sakazakii]